MPPSVASFRQKLFSAGSSRPSARAFVFRTGVFFGDKRLISGFQSSYKNEKDGGGLVPGIRAVVHTGSVASRARLGQAEKFIPLVHSTRARVKTSTEVAPDWRRTRAHSSTVAPVVITSSTISTRRFLMRSGLVTTNARRMFLIRSSWCCEVWGGV